MRIVVADDLAENRLFLEALLRGHGYEPVLARNGQEALAEIRRAGADLVISDILMPVMDGYQLCRALKADAALRQIPLVFYTATYTTDEDRVFALGIGASRFIVKPMDPDAFIGVIRDVLAQAERGRLGAPEPQIDRDAEFLQAHSQRVSRKLEQKKEELDAARALLQEVFLSMGEGLAVIEPDFTIRLANQAFAALAGADPAALAGKSCRELTRCWQSGVADPGAQCPVRATLQTGAAAVGNFTRQGPGGGTVETEVRSYPLRDAAGAVTAAIEIVRDISEQRRLEAQLVQSQKMEMVGQLAGGVAHDFNNILGVVMGHASLLATRLQDAETARHLAEVLEACERGARLTRSLLAFSRKQVLEVKAVALADVVSGTARLLRHVIGEDVEVRTELRDGGAVILGDAGLLQQALMNLATNARDAMPGGGTLLFETVRAEIDADFVRTHGFGVEGHYALVTVRDTGSGMEPAVRARAFEPFFTTKPPGHGTGLGLSLVYGTVRQHDGFVSLSSEPGAGTTVRIYLPLAQAASPEAAPCGETAPRGGCETILVAEDDAALRELSRELLEQAGYSVLVAADGEEALEVLRSHRERVRLVFSDLVMPRMSGRELARRVRSEAPGVPVLFMSGYPAELLRGREQLEPDFRLVMKPLRVNELLRVVREMLDAGG